MPLMGAKIRFNSRKCIAAKDGREFVIGTLFNEKLYKASVEHAAVAHAQIPD